MTRGEVYHNPTDGWLAIGWYVAGFEYLGPFDTEAEAVEFATSHKGERR